MSRLILYEDPEVVVVDKPPGLLVHKTDLAPDSPETLQEELEKKFSRKIYPVHRLDRPTSGVMVFAFSSESARVLGLQFAEQTVQKSYLALVRGHLQNEQLIEHPLTDKIDGLKSERTWPARSLVKPVALAEIPVQIDRYPVSRYSLVDVRPLTGRTHQIRRHLKFLNHPIIGDVNHGHSKHNRYFAERFGARRLYLDCYRLMFAHPGTGKPLVFARPVPSDFMGVITDLFPAFDFSFNA